MDIRLSGICAMGFNLALFLEKPKDAVTKVVPWSPVPLLTESPDFVQGSERLNVRPAFLPAAEFGDMIAKEDAELARIMQLIGVKKAP